MVSKTFCSIPWVHVAINSNGTFRPCCNISYLEEDHSEEKNLGKTPNQKIREVWNSEKYRSFRKKMIIGEKIPVCSRCYREEESGIRSARITANEMYFNSIEKIEPSGFCSIESIKYIDVRLGNRCNIKCRMCNPFSSDQWIEEERISHLRNVDEDTLITLEKMSWFNNDLFWDDLFSILPSCDLLYFSGGEPMMFTDQQSTLFERCIDKGISEKLKLRYNTNATILSNKLIEYWKHFNKVKINCSIDGMGKVNDYIRYPSKWNTIDKNLRYLLKLKNENQFSIEVHTTVQIYNSFGLDDLFEYLKRLGIFPYLNILNHPAHYNIKVLKPEKKKIVTSLLKCWYNENSEWLRNHEKSSKKLLSIIEYMNKEDWSYLYPDFLTETRILDSIRKQKLEDFIPELL